MPDRPHRLGFAAQSAQDLRDAYRRRDLSPIEVAHQAMARMDELDARLGAVILPLRELALRQADAAERAWAQGEAGRLAGIPITIKDTFDIAGHVTTRGSAIHRHNIALEDSGVIRRLRAAGAVFVAKTSTAEFGQSATCENMLEGITRNPWDPDMTPGGSSGGAAVSVAAGYVPLALGADGGGSIRIPAAMTGIVGFKPTYGLCRDEGGFRAMSDFACAGPLSNSVADARLMLEVLAAVDFPRGSAPRGLRIAYCRQPEGHPVDSLVATAIATVAECLATLGHKVEAVDPDFSGWADAFGPLVVAEEGRERGHLLAIAADKLTKYERAALRAAATLTPEIIAHAREQLRAYGAKMDALFNRFDAILTPATACAAFPIGTRPDSIAGIKVDRVWGAFPFTPMFNVAGNPAASLPCGFAGHLPVGAQIAMRRGADASLLDLCEDLEAAIGFKAVA